MQQRQLRLGDILDDYCPRERRVTNHAVVAMVGPDVKQTRCTTCDAEHEYKHARIPRQRRKADTPAALYAQVAAGRLKPPAPHEPASAAPVDPEPDEMTDAPPAVAPPSPPSPPDDAFDRVSGNSVPEEPSETTEDENEAGDERDEGPVHRPLIRASLPRPEGQAPAARPVPDFTIRQPGGRPNRFRPRHQRGGGGGQMFHGNRPAGYTGGLPRGTSRNGNRPPAHRHGRKRSK